VKRAFSAGVIATLLLSASMSLPSSVVYSALQKVLIREFPLYA
jgi:hypothetical protein